MDPTFMSVSNKHEEMNNPWFKYLGLRSVSDIQYIEPKDGPKESTIAMLPHQDMALFGFCPFQDDFVLTKCKCGIVMKPQVLKSHLENHKNHIEDSVKGGDEHTVKGEDEHSVKCDGEHSVKGDDEHTKSASYRELKKSKPKNHVISPYSHPLKSFQTTATKAKIPTKQLPQSSILLPGTSILIPTSSDPAVSVAATATTNNLFSTYTNFLYTYNTTQPTTSNHYLPSPSSSSLSSSSSSPVSLVSDGTVGMTKAPKSLLPSKKVQFAAKTSLLYSPKSSTGNRTFVSSSAITDCPRLEDMRNESSSFSIAAGSAGTSTDNSNSTKTENKTPALEKLVLRRVLQSAKKSSEVRRTSLHKGTKGDPQSDNSTQETYFMVVKDKTVEKQSNFLAATQQIKKESNEAHQQNDRVWKKMRELEGHRDSIISQLFQELTHVKKKLRDCSATKSELQKELTMVKVQLTEKSSANAELETLQKQNLDLQRELQQLRVQIDLYATSRSDMEQNKKLMEHITIQNSVSLNIAENV